MRKKIFIVGSTGALGREAIQVMRNNEKIFKLVGITGFNNYEKIIEQCEQFKPRYLGIRGQFVSIVKQSCNCPILFDAETDLSKVLLDSGVDMVLFLSSGISAVKPIISLLQHKIQVGIANKESIIAGGELIFKKNLSKYIVPVDSEPSAIFQALMGENKTTVKKLIITASGGPFWGTDKNLLEDVSPENALKHPNWKMGKKITIDSATMVNKAFEVVESHFLFGMEYTKIDAIVHRESIVHSLVEFLDGNIKAILSPTRMYYPIQFALTYPKRTESCIGYLDLVDTKKLTFYKMNHNKFPAFDTALNIAKQGGSFLPILTAADEVAVDAFLKKEIRFTDINNVISDTLMQFSSRNVVSAGDVEELYKDGIMMAKKIVRRRRL